MYNQRTNKPISENYMEQIKKHVGKRVKLEYLTPNQNNEIYGQLIKTGKDFVSIKLPTSPLTCAILNIDKIIKLDIIYE